MKPSSLRMRAISSFSLEAGESTLACRARIALRMRDRKSATGSVVKLIYFSSTVRSPRRAGEPATALLQIVFSFEFLVFCSKLKTENCYQDDLETPGISPLSARLRKHKRQMPNLRRKPRGRPQIAQRLCWRDENFGFRASLTRFAVVAIKSFYCRNGMPMCFKSARASLSFLAVVTMVTFMPFCLSILA